MLVLRNLLFGERQHNAKEFRQYDRRSSTSVGVHNLSVKSEQSDNLVQLVP